MKYFHDTGHHYDDNKQVAVTTHGVKDANGKSICGSYDEKGAYKIIELLNTTIGAIAEAHFDWVEGVGWHKDKSPLEYLALMCSEIGEAVNECRHGEPTQKLGEELADIILRTLDMALVCKIDIEKAIMDKMRVNQERGSRGRLK